MAEKRRVIAYTMHEHEQAEATARLENAVPADGFVIGEAEDSTIAELRTKGLIIRDLGAASALRARSVPGPGVAASSPECCRRVRCGRRGSGDVVPARAPMTKVRPPLRGG